ncbi:MAG TPA: helix-turn-helix domain-containing protein [Mycobacteriales bacterium]|jgi:hypothetical protein|nr:helix-turn-helix domain-containing protein [Mycobacteriales bacterium]
MADVEKNKRLSAADRDKLGARLEKAYGKGQSIAALAEETGTSAGRVRLILLERGVVLRPRGGNTRKPDPERNKRAKAIAAEYRAGASLAQLGATHGVSATTARNLVLAGGGDLRARGGRKPAAT